ncbi:MAG TPA: hypothetical protein VGA73_04600 [Candidatus Binatia bacterium]
MEKKFRKYIGRFEFWHFHPSCPDRPQGNYIHRSRLSAGARVCTICLYLAEKDAAPKPEKNAHRRRDLSLA